MKRAIGKYYRDFLAIIVLIVIAAGVGGFILSQERLRFPFIQAKPTNLYADFSTAQAVTPGQGQTVRVSGVQVGSIDGVKLHDGVARVTMAIDHKYDKLVHTDATALLRPKTGLKDMFIELNPGSHGAPVAQAGWSIPVANTLPDVNPDEVLASLDTDARDYLQLLISGGAAGLRHRASDLQQVFERFSPTLHDLARVNHAVSMRHQNLSRVIRSLNLLNTALAERGPQVTSLVANSSQVFNAFANVAGPIKRAITDLPGTLVQTRTTLGKVRTFANVLGPAAKNLQPAALALPAANKALIPFARKTTPVVRDQIRPFVVDSRPLVRALKPASEHLAKATPSLTSSFVVLNHLFNMLGYNKSGPNASTTDPNRDEGYLFWIAWVTHDGASVFGSSDANGVLRSISQQSNCGTLRGTVGDITKPLGLLQAQATGALNVLLDPTLCANGQA